MGSGPSSEEEDVEDYMTMEIPGLEDAEKKQPTSPRTADESSLLSTDSKALRMMKKMGYDPGKGLGKDQGGISKPIELSLKRDRTGIGLESTLKKYKAEAEEKQQTSNQTYRQRNIQLADEKKWSALFVKIRNICIDLDKFDDSSDVLPENPIYRGYIKEKRLKREIHILREKLIYGEEDTVTELNDSDHDSDHDPEQSNKQSETFEKLSPKEKFSIANNYLRDEFNYCFWCGSEIDELCPGPEEDDHE